VEENSVSIFGTISKLANQKDISRSFDGRLGPGLFGGARVNRKLIDTKNYSFRRIRDVFNVGEKFSESAQNIIGERLRNPRLYKPPSFNNINGEGFLRNYTRRVRFAFSNIWGDEARRRKNYRGNLSILSTKYHPRRKKRRPLKVLDFITLIPALVVYLGKYILDRIAVEAVQIVGRDRAIFSLMRDTSGEGLAGKLMTSLDSFRFGVGVLKIVAKDSIEAAIPAILIGAMTSSPLFGGIIGGLFFTSKFALDFTSYFSVQNPLVVNIVQRVGSSFLDTTLSTPELLFNSTTFSFGPAFVTLVALSFLGVGGLPLALGVGGVFAGSFVTRIISNVLIGRNFSTYADLSSLDVSELRLGIFKSEYLTGLGIPSLGIGVGLFLATGLPIFLVIPGVGITTGIIADFFKSSYIEDITLHDISSVSTYDVLHSFIGAGAGGFLIGTAFLGPVGGLIFGIGFSGASIAINLIQKAGSRFVVKPEDFGRFTSEVELRNLASLTEEEFYRKLYMEYHYTPRMVDNFGGGSGFRDYLERALESNSSLDLEYINGQFSRVIYDTLADRQSLLLRFDPARASDYFREIDSIALEPKMEDYLAKFVNIEGEPLPADLIGRLVKDGELKTLYDAANSRDLADSDEVLAARSDFISRVYRADFSRLTGISEDDLSKLANSTTIRGLDSTRFPAKFFSQQGKSLAEISDALKSGRFSDFINEARFKIDLVNHLDNINVEGINASEIAGKLRNSSLRDFLRERGIDLDASYSEFIQRFNEIEAFKGMDMLPAFEYSDFAVSLQGAGITLENIFRGVDFPAGIERMDLSSLRNISDDAIGGNAIRSDISKILFENGEIERLWALNMRDLMDIYPERSIFSIGKIGAVRDIRLPVPVLDRIPLSDILESVNSGFIGGAILAFVFGVTSPVAVLGIMGGTLAARVGIKYLSAISDTRWGVAEQSIFYKTGIQNTFDLVEKGFLPGLIAYAVTSYFLGPVAGVVAGIAGGGLYVGYKFATQTDLGFFSKATGFMSEGVKFLGEAGNGLFLADLGINMTTEKFWEGLTFQLGSAAFVSSLLQTVFGGLVIGSMVGAVLGAAELADIAGFAGVLTGIGAGALGLLGITAGTLLLPFAVGTVIFVGGVVVVNWIVEKIFGHGIFFYLGEGAKSLWNSVSSWLFGRALGASIGLDILIGFISIFFRGEMDVEDFIRTVFIMVVMWSLIGGNFLSSAFSGSSNNNTSNTLNNKTQSPTYSFLTSPSSGQIINIEKTPNNITADNVFVKTDKGVIQLTVNNPYLYKGEVVYKGEYLGN
jgi:hypothetical protein